MQIKTKTSLEKSSFPGRPSSYRPQYCEMLEEHLAKGFSFESFGALVSHGKDVLYDWVKLHPAFKRAKEVGWMKALYWHEKAMMKCAANRELNPTPLIYLMNNKFRK